MPTGARLVSAIVFAALAYLAATIVHGILEREAGSTVNVSYFKEIMAVIGVLCGWIIMGKRASNGLRAAIGGGILTSVAIVFWGLLAFSLREMIILSTKMRYDGATEATVDVFRIALEHAQTIADPSLIITLVVGGMIGGWMAVWANRRFN